MTWLLVVTAGLFETGFAVSLKLSHGMTRLWPTVGFAACALLSFALLTVALRQLEVGAANAVWTGIGAAYSFFLGRLGGRAFEDRPWAGFAVAFGVTIAVSGLVEVMRRIRRSRERSGRRHAGQVESDDPGQDQADRDQLHGGHRVAKEDHAGYGRPGGPDPGPDRVRSSDLELAQCDSQQGEAQQRARGEADCRP